MNAPIISASLFLIFSSCTYQVVSADLLIESITINNEKVPILTWASSVGVKYQIESKNRLLDAEWMPEGEVLTADGAKLTWSDSSHNILPERFYRLRVVDGGSQNEPKLSFTNPGPGGGSFLMSIALDATDPDQLYLGGDIEGPFYSSDGGQNYSRISGNLAGSDKSAAVYAAQMFHIDPSDSKRVYMATWGGLYRTDNQGGSWSYLNLDSEYAEGELQVASVAVSPFDSNLILAGTGDVESNLDGTSAIYRSTDDGASFVNVADVNVFQREDTVVSGFWFHPENPGVVFAATSEGVFISRDHGEQWFRRNQGLPLGIDGAPEVHGIQGVVHEGQAVLFVVLRTQQIDQFIAGGIWRSFDEGETWLEITGNLPRELEANPEDPEDIQRAYFYWRVAVDPNDPENVYIGTQNGEGELGGESYVSAWEDMGVYGTWNALEENGHEVEWDYLMYPEVFDDPGWLFFPWWNDLHISFLGIDPQNPDILYAGGNSVYKSTDEGRTWSQAYSKTLSTDTFRGGSGLELMEPFDMAISPSQPNVWWVGYDDMGLFRTDDAGASWVRMDDQQQSENLGAMDCACGLLIDPDDPNIVYQARTEGENDQPGGWSNGFVFKTEDHGKTWNQIGMGQLSEGRPFLLMLPGGNPDTRKIFAAIYGKGLFVSNDSGINWIQSDSGLDDYSKQHVWTMAYDPSNTSILYAGVSDSSLNDDPVDGGVFRSDDGGANWKRLTNTAPTGQVIDLAVAEDGVVYAASSDVFSTLRQGIETRKGGLYRSVDHGEHWELVLDTKRADYVDTAPGDSRYVVAGVSTKFDRIGGLQTGVFVSRDSGHTFRQENDGLSMTRLWFLKFHSSDKNQIFVGTGGAGLFHGTGVVGAANQ